MCEISHVKLDRLAYMERYHDDPANCRQEIVVAPSIQRNIITVVFSCLSGIEA